MSLYKIMKNLVATIYIALITLLSIVQLKSGNNILESGAKISAPFVSIIVFAVLVIIAIVLFFILREFLRAKNISKSKIKIVEVIYISIIFLVERTIFGIVFLNEKIPLSDLTLMHKELVSLDAFTYNVLLKIIEKINDIVTFPMLSVYIFNTLIFVISTILIRKILRVATENEVFLNIGTFIFVLAPKFIFESMLINPEIINMFLILFSIYLIFKILTEVKIIKGKSYKYIILAVVLGILMSTIAYTGNSLTLWALALITINTIIKNIDLIHIKFSNRTLMKLNSFKRAKLYKIEKVYIRKSVIALSTIIVSFVLGKFIVDATTSIVTRKDFNFYSNKEIYSLFGSITEKDARDQLIDINFKVDKNEIESLNYNIGKSILDIKELSKQGKLRDATRLAKTVEKTINKPISKKEILKNKLTKTINIYKDDINNVNKINKIVKNVSYADELMYISNIAFQAMFVIMLFAELFCVILKREVSEKTAIIKLFMLVIVVTTFIYGSYISTNMTLTALAIIVLVKDIVDLYKNTQGRVKALGEAKYNF